jgi:signal transduction histidine kinase
MARYALVAGIAKYSNSSLPDLSKTATDAAAVAEVLKQHGSYRVTLLNGEVKAKQLADALKTLLREQAVKNEALIYFTGHGIRGVTGVDILEQPQGFLAASDCNVTKAGEQWIVRDGVISLNNLNQLIRQSDLSNLVVIFDSCHSGEFLERGLVENALTVFRSQQDYYLITACRRFEQSWAKKSEQHSVFTGALLAGLSQERAGDNGQVTVDRLFDYIASELSNSRQEPIRMGVGRSLTLVQYRPKKTEIVVDETCPYQGLEAFGKEQARFFFGREKVVQLLMEKLGQANFVPIIGASGSGKSSVVRAGLIPQLEKNGWRVLEPILPGVEPLAELKRALLGLFGRTEVREVYSLIEAEGLRSVIERLSGSERLLLVVDQFEEVFTVCPKEEERRQFIELLTQAAEIPNSPLAIVTTMRADFLEPCLSYESLTQLIQNEAVYMPPLIGAQLEEAIASPTKLQGYRLETGLLGAILQDVGQENGCLPLLQFALTELWEQRDRQTHKLTLAKYNDLDGVIGALNRHADQIYHSFTEQQQDWVKRIFLKLVRTGVQEKDTRQRQPKAKLLAITGDKPDDQEAISTVLDKLVDGRLLVSDREGEDWVDLAHEALMEGWEQFAAWRQEDRELRRLIDRVEDALREWQKNPQDENLMMGGLLVQVRERWTELQAYLPLSAKEFYQRSEVHEQEQLNKLSQWQQQIAELAKALQDLQQRTQSQLVQTEKMSSLGQLVAGVAHEINNPVNFITGNINYACEYIQDLLTLVELYQLHDPQLVEDIQSQQNIDLEFLRQDLPKLFMSMQVGADRLNQIVLSLRNFSRLGEAEMKPVDIHEGIDNTLMILRNRLKAKRGQPDIPVTKEYGQLPLVECYAGQLNQVFMNLISNAIDALEERQNITAKMMPLSACPLPYLQIRTEAKGNDWVSITITDNGVGMTEEVQQRLFNPFFTTKPLGKGTGLGLSISYQIVAEKHGGTIEVRSEAGQGTEFVITLPIRQLSNSVRERSYGAPTR